MTRLVVLTLLFVAAPLAAQTPVPPHLKNYVTNDDGAYAWKLGETTKDGGTTVANLKLTSQKWQGETWEHDVQIVVPKGVTPGATAALYITGGNPSPTMSAFALAVAEKARVPVAVLFQIPKQPLYGKKEDALIAETFVKYLETQDPTWPLLFPMAKSAVKCMDAVQAFAKQEWKSEVTGFVVCGASKRGWTTWLTAATGDKRVKGIAPMVFDSLNLQEQMPNQVKSFGKFSAMIKDYEDRKLLPLPDTTEARQLWAMVDPWVYRETIEVPKLLIHGTNDPYWTQDALNFYWKDLKGPKNVVYVPNAGHDLRPMKDPAAAAPMKDLFPTKAVDSLAAFCRSVAEGKSLPEVEATFPDGKDAIDVKFDLHPKTIRTMKCTSTTRDFRKQKWQVDGASNEQHPGVTRVQMTTNAPYLAFFVEAEYEVDGQKFCLSTPIRIVEKKK